MCLIARYFEARGLPTLILGSGLDILSSGKPPRARFLNYPLGFESGQPFDQVNQLAVLKAAVSGFDSMIAPGIEHMDFSWDAGWQMIAERNNNADSTDLRSPRDLTPRYQTERDREMAEG